MEYIVYIPVLQFADAITKDARSVRASFRGGHRTSLCPSFDALSRAVPVNFCDWSPDDVGSTSVDLEIDYFDVEDYVGGVVDCKVCCAEFLELVPFRSGLVEG
jgi:hypothetical protein